MEKNIVEWSGMAFDVMQYTVLNGLEVIDSYLQVWNAKNTVDCCETKWRFVEWCVMGFSVTQQLVTHCLGKEWSLILQNGTLSNTVQCCGMQSNVVEWS